MNGRLSPFVSISQTSQGFPYPYLTHPPKAEYHLSQQGQGPAAPGYTELGGSLPEVIFNFLSLHSGAPSPSRPDTKTIHSLSQIVPDPPSYTPTLYTKRLGYLVPWHTPPYVIHCQSLDPDISCRAMPCQVIQFLLLLGRQFKCFYSHAHSIPHFKTNVTIFS